MECGIVLEPEIERLLQENQKDYDAIVHESILDSSAEIDLKERELALLRKSIEDNRAQREKQVNRIQTLERLIDDRTKLLEAKEKQVGSVKRQLSNYCRDIDAKEREYRAISRSVEERSLEMESMGAALRLVQKEVGECERNLRRKQEDGNWQLETINQLISERDEVHKKIERAIEACGVDLGVKESRLRMVEGLIREREQELEVKDVELDNIHRDWEWKEGELRELSVRIADCDKELRAKEEELDSMQRLVDGEGKELEFKRRNLLKFMKVKVNQLVKELESSNKEFDSFRRPMREKSVEIEEKEKKLGEEMKDLELMKKQFEGRVKEFESKEKQFEGRVKEIELREKQFEGQAKELEAEKMQFIGRVKECESKEKQLEGQLQELKAKEKNLEVQEKMVESKEKQYEGQVQELKAKKKQLKVRRKELESKEKELEGQVKDLESQKNQYVGKMKELEFKKAMDNEQLEGHKSKVKQLETPMKDLEFKRNQYEEKLKELELKETQLNVQLMEFQLKEKQIEDLDSKKNQYEEQVKELELKEAQFRLALKNLESEQKQFEGTLKDLQSKQKQLERQQKELELKEKRCESLRNSFEEGQVLKEKSNILLHQVKSEPQDFTGADGVNNCKNLQLLFNLLKNYELVCSQVSDALQTSADPSIMVLVTINGFCSPQLRQELSECDANISKRVRNLLMDELKKSSPVIGSHVKQEAMKFASDWKASIAVADTDCLEVLDFLKFVATYEIGSSFNEHELQSLLDIISQHCQAPQALGNFEELPDNQSCPTTADGRNLQLLSNEPELIGNDILACLQTSIDPATLVLDIIQSHQQNKRENEGVIIDENHIIILDQLMRISPSPPIKPHIRDEAKKLAIAVKATINTRDENSSVVLGFLLLLSIYGLVPFFNEDEVFTLFEFIIQHKQAVELFRTLGFADKISVFVQNLIEKKQYIEAVRFVCAYKLADKFDPVDLLRREIGRAHKISCKISRKTHIQKKLRYKDIEIHILGQVLQSISDNNLESPDLVNEVQRRILVVQKLKEELIAVERQKEELGHLVSKLSSTPEVHQPEEKKCANDASPKNQVQRPEEKISADIAVTENQVKVQQTKEKEITNEAVTKNQVQVQPAEAKKPVDLQQQEAKKPSSGTLSKKQAKKLRRMQSADGAGTMTQVQQPEAQKPANGAVTMNQAQAQHPVVNTNESVTTNQVLAQQSQEKKRPIEAVPNNHPLHQSQSGYDNKRPRTGASHSLPPRDFTPQYQHTIIPSGRPAPFGLPPHYYGVADHSGADYFRYPRPYPPFR